MRDTDFDHWLEHIYRTASGSPMDPRARSSRMSNCRTVERSEGDLDAHYRADRMEALLARFSYNKDDVAAGRPARHAVPINGNIYNGTATLRSALNLYRRFSDEWPEGAEPPRPHSRPSAVGPVPRAPEARVARPMELDAGALETMRETFLDRALDFGDFRDQGGAYWENECVFRRI